MHVYWLYTVGLAISFAASVILTPLVRHLALRLGCVATPRPDRWHKKKTGLFGGVAIFLSVTGTWLVISLVFLDFNTAIKPLAFIVLAGCAIFFLGLSDDLFELNPQYKLIGQVVVASIMVLLGFQVNWFDSMTANQLVSIFWIVGITNAFNLLDNMDGLAAGIALISCCFLFLWLVIEPTAFQNNQPSQNLLIISYIGGMAGFLIYNYHPASIFMGDAGSLFIGFMLAAMIIAVNPVGTGSNSVFNQLTVIFIPVLILFVPILDTTFVSFMRKVKARSIFQGGTDHSSHRMVAGGLSEKKAVLVLYLFSVLSGVIALLIIPLGLFVSIFIIALHLLLVFLFWLYLANVDVYPQDNKSYVETGQSHGKLRADYGKTLLSIVFDLVLITMAYYAAYLLRFEGDIGPDFSFFLKSLPIMFAC